MEEIFNNKEIRPEYLYKYMTFEQFVDLIENKQLYLTNITSWEDVYEGYTIREFFNYINQKKDIEDINIRKNEIDFSIKCRYAQSWTNDDVIESDAMWRIYSPQKTGVRVKVKFKDIYDSIKDILDEAVPYEEKDGRKQSISKFLSDEPNFRKIEYYKPINFDEYKKIIVNITLKVKRICLCISFIIFRLSFIKERHLYMKRNLGFLQY